MNTILCLIAHTPLASALLATAEHVFGEQPLVVIYDIPPDVEPDSKTEEVAECLATMAQAKDGETLQILVLTDLVGATPSNIGARAVQKLQAQGIRSHILTGANACMVLNAIRYRQLPLDTLCESVIEGGFKGVKCADIMDWNKTLF